MPLALELHYLLRLYLQEIHPKLILPDIACTEYHFSIHHTCEQVLVNLPVWPSDLPCNQELLEYCKREKLQ
jgi:hypothetical protein